MSAHISVDLSAISIYADNLFKRSSEIAALRERLTRAISAIPTGSTPGALQLVGVMESAPAQLTRAAASLHNHATQLKLYVTAIQQVEALFKVLGTPDSIKGVPLPMWMLGANPFESPLFDLNGRSLVGDAEHAYDYLDQYNELAGDGGFLTSLTRADLPAGAFLKSLSTFGSVVEGTMATHDLLSHPIDEKSFDDMMEVGTGGYTLAASGMNLAAGAGVELPASMTAAASLGPEAGLPALAYAGTSVLERHVAALEAQGLTPAQIYERIGQAPQPLMDIEAGEYTLHLGVKKIVETVMPVKDVTMDTIAPTTQAVIASQIKALYPTARVEAVDGSVRIVIPAAGNQWATIIQVGNKSGDVS